MGSTQQNIGWEELVSEAKASMRHGSYADAESKYNAALAAAEHQFGKDTSHFAVILSELGECFEAQGKESQAEDCFQRVRDILKLVSQ
jgi:tetratricopeptide (TPR) repeat protein